MISQGQLFITIAVACLFVGVIFFYGWRFSQQHRLLKKRLLLALNLEEEEAKKTQKEHTALQETGNNTPAVSSERQPPVFSPQKAGKNNTPEKYRYVSSLVDHGMDATEISEILKISSAEAEQLIKLSQMTRSRARNH